MKSISSRLWTKCFTRSKNMKSWLGTERPWVCVRLGLCWLPFFDLQRKCANWSFFDFLKTFSSELMRPEMQMCRWWTYDHFWIFIWFNFLLNSLEIGSEVYKRLGEQIELTAFRSEILSAISCCQFRTSILSQEIFGDINESLKFLRFNAFAFIFITKVL